MEGEEDMPTTARLLEMPIRENILPTIDEVPPTPPPPPFETVPAPLPIAPAVNTTDSKKKLDQLSSEGEEASPDDSFGTLGRRIPFQVEYKYKRRPKHTAAQVLSSLYAKLLVITVLVMVLTELLHNRIALFYYHGYLFSFILGGGIMFIFLMYMGMATDSCCREGTHGNIDECPSPRSSDISVYIRTVVLVLGLGSLISTGLEIGVMFTMDNSCVDRILHKIQPILMAVFTFLQMHVLFLDGKRVIVALGCFRSIALMHLVAANISVWARLVLWDSARSWLIASHLTYNSSLAWPPASFNYTLHSLDQHGRHRVHFTRNCQWKDYTDRKESQDYLQYYSCLKNSTVGVIWDEALPFLSPFIIQYSLAAVSLLYTLWVGPAYRIRRLEKRYPSSRGGTLERKSSQQRDRIDCRGSTKGLFLGILVLVVGVIVMILFFVLRGNNRLHQGTLFIVSIVHCSILGVSILAMLIGLLQIQQMCSTNLDQWPPHQLLQSYGIIAVMVFGVFSLIVGATNVHTKPFLIIIIDASLMIFHACVQCLFINKMAFKSCPNECDHQKYRPGRQVVAFLIFTNFILWLMETFTSQNHILSHIQLDFYGAVVWDLITRLTLPIIMLYRIHSTVLCAEAWKNAYRS